MGKLRFTLTTLLFWPILLLTTFLCTNLNFLRESSFPFFDTTSFVLITVLIIALMIFYYVLEHKNNKVKIHYILFPIMLMLTVLFIAMIWIQPVQTFTGTYGEVTVDANKYKIFYSIETALMMSLFYMLTFTFSRKQLAPKSIRWLIVIYLLFVLVSIVFSLIKDFENLKILFKPESGKTYQGLTSFYYNENVFAMSLTIGLLALFILNSFKPRWYWYVPMLIIFVFIILTTSATAIFISLAAFGLYVILDLALLIKRRLVIGLIMSGVTVFLVVGTIIGIALLYHNNVTDFTRVIDFFFKDLINKDFQTFTKRTEIWKNVWESLLKDNPIYIMFGRGNGIAYRYFHGMLGAKYYNFIDYGEAIHSTHNGYVDILMKFGVFGLILYGVALVYFLICCIYLIAKKKVGFALASLISVLAVSLYAMFESNYFFDLNYFSLIQTLFFILPTINYARTLKKPAISKNLVEENKYINKIDTRRLTTLIASILLSGIITIPLMFLSTKIYQHPLAAKIALIVEFILIISFVFAPGIISSIYKDRSKTRSIIYLSLYFGVFIGLMTGCYFLFNLLPDSFTLYVSNYVLLGAVAITYYLIGFILATRLNKYRFKLYLRDLFIETFKLNIIPIILSVILGAAIIIPLSFMVGINMYAFFAIYLIILTIYVLTFLIQKNNVKSYFIHFLNECSLNRTIKLSKI